MAAFMAKHWRIWHTSLKVAMPILHLAFCAAQLHGANIARILALKYRRLAREGEDAQADESIAPIVVLPIEKVVDSSAHSSRSTSPETAPTVHEA